ncbi:MAG TPA: 5'-nucleotidase C-terminal domain-containing protein [Sporosarcina sp.]|nr:5'-nucleotidase C-terminal domain-containing protein [Sporosarcina sp.]
METIHILHTNDLHSHFEYWPQIRRFLLEKRALLEAENEAVYVVDIGDFVDRSHSFTEATNGKGNIMFLNEAHYDAVTIGNNEGITMSKEDLSSLYDDATFDVIVGNVREPNGKLPQWARASTVYMTSKGTKVGLIGATAYYDLFYGALGWNVEEAKTRLIAEAENLKEDVDILICLSHLGIYEDRKLAALCPSIDVILGAHTHHILPEGEWINDTLMAATGKYGQFVGYVTVDIDEETKSIVQQTATLVRSSDLPASREDKQYIQQQIEAGKVALLERVFYNENPLKQNLFGESELASFFGRALLHYTNADCALFNAGIFLGSLEEGWVTKEQLHKILPHPINVCTIELTGEQLYEVYEQSFSEELPSIKVTGLGFRGTIMGNLIRERLYKNRHGVLFAGNRQVRPTETYRLATLDMFTFGFFFPQFKTYPKQYYVPELIRDVFGQYGQFVNESTTRS